MESKQLPSELFRQTWDDYQNTCRREGLVSLTRFCEGRSVPVQRLYEWLRCRHISVKGFQAGISGSTTVTPKEESPFIPLAVSTTSAQESGIGCMEDVHIDPGGGRVAIRIGRMPPEAFAMFMHTVKSLC